MNELVSIVIPVYNQEKYLEKSVASALSQSYQNIEIVCVNDGSTDSSRLILEKFRNHDSRIKIVDQENGGLVHAVVTGVRNVSGKYLCFLDSDDYIGENYVEYFLNHIGDSDFVAAGHYIDNGKHITENKTLINAEYSRDGIQELIENLVWDNKNKRLSKNILNSRWNKMYRTEIVRRYIDSYDDCSGISFGEDTIFTYFLLKNSMKCRAISELNSYYYNTGNQNSMMTSGKIEQHIEKAKSSFELLKKYMESNNDYCGQAYVMYYFLIESLFQRLEYMEGETEFKELYSRLKRDRDYQKALTILIKNSRGKRRLVFSLRKHISVAKIYKILFNISR